MEDSATPSTALAYLNPSYWDERFSKEEQYECGNPWNPKPETISKVMATLKGVHGVLKAGGTFISVTFGQGQRSSHDDIPPVKRRSGLGLSILMLLVYGLCRAPLT
ncbi:hypothetical protein JHK84_033144 [Glycine max]|nr:hypothetical protein JHK84_033144 [Glycine max]